jgi:hypothetical protein
MPLLKHLTILFTEILSAPSNFDALGRLAHLCHLHLIQPASIFPPATLDKCQSLVSLTLEYVDDPTIHAILCTGGSRRLEHLTVSANVTMSLNEWTECLCNMRALKSITLSKFIGDPNILIALMSDVAPNLALITLYIQPSFRTLDHPRMYAVHLCNLALKRPHVSFRIHLPPPDFRRSMVNTFSDVASMTAAFPDQVVSIPLYMDDASDYDSVSNDMDD